MFEGKIAKVEFEKGSKWVAKWGQQGEICISRNLAGSPDFNWIKIFQDALNTAKPARGCEILSGSLVFYPINQEDVTSAKLVAEAALKHTNEKVEKHNAEWEKQEEQRKKWKQESEEKRRKELEEAQRKLDES